MNTLYVGFKGSGNASNKLVNCFEGDKLFLTNSFDGLKRDIENLKNNYDIIYMFGLDKNLNHRVRVEKVAMKDGEIAITGLDVEKVAESIKSVGIDVTVNSITKNSLCNAAYFHMLKKYDGKAVFIHIPSIKYITDEFVSNIKEAVRENCC